VGTPGLTPGLEVPFWISGTTDPPVAGLTVEFSGFGSFQTSVSGSYFGLLPFGYSGTATPQFQYAQAFVPPFRVYENLESDTTGQDYAWIPAAPALASPWTLSATAMGAYFQAVAIPAQVSDAAWFQATAWGAYAALPGPGLAFDQTGQDADAFGTYQPVVALAAVSSGGGRAPEQTVFQAEPLGWTEQVIFTAAGTDKKGS
jgi:hypothetical protein